MEAEEAKLQSEGYVINYVPQHFDKFNNFKKKNNQYFFPWFITCSFSNAAEISKTCLNLYIIN